MAILSTVKKIIPYLKTATGYVLYRLSSQAVEMDDGTILQDKIESMDSTINTKAPNSHSHTGNQINGLTPSRALISGTLGQITESAVTSTEIQYLDGVTSNIQTQLNNKAANSHTHTATQVTGLTASRAMISDSSGHPSVSNVTSTELNYLDGATSNIQNQINTLNSNSNELEETLENKIQYREIQVEIRNGNNLPEGGFSSGAVDVSTEFPSAKKVVAIGGRRSGTQYVCTATVENNSTLYCNANSTGVYKVTIIGFY